MMTSEMSVEIQPDAVAQIVESVFGTMMNLEISESRTPWFPSVDRLTAAVHLAGDWSGAVLLECNERQARHFAGLFLSMDPPDTVDEAVRDVLGELANMIGGNVKCVLTPGIKLSLPAVVDGGGYSARLCRAEVRERLAFACAEGPFWITILTTPSSA
jgi:chemotaxis protein CheX